METISSFFSTYAINTHPLLSPSIPHPATLGFGQLDQKPSSPPHVHVFPSSTAKSINQLLSENIIGVLSGAPHLKQWSAAAHEEGQKAPRQTDRLVICQQEAFVIVFVGCFRGWGGGGKPLQRLSRHGWVADVSIELS